MLYLPLVLISKTKAGSGPKFMEIKCCQICLTPLGLFHNFIIVASEADLLGNSNIFSAPPLIALLYRNCSDREQKSQAESRKQVIVHLDC